MAFGHGIGYKKTLVPQWIRGRSYSATVHEASHAMTPRKIEIGLAYLDFFSDFQMGLGKLDGGSRF